MKFFKVILSLIKNDFTVSILFSIKIGVEHIGDSFIKKVFLNFHKNSFSSLNTIKKKPFHKT
jgi:hypothetical protein